VRAAESMRVLKIYFRSKDNTISYDGQKYQILPDPYRANYAGARVEVQEHLNGKMSVIYNGRRLRHMKITRSTKKQRREALKEEASRQGDISIRLRRGPWVYPWLNA
jgi:hypothetical protein